jgi:hypothetical protein
MVPGAKNISSKNRFRFNPDSHFSVCLEKEEFGIWLLFFHLSRHHKLYNAEDRYPLLTTSGWDVQSHMMMPPVHLAQFLCQPQTSDYEGSFIIGAGNFSLHHRDQKGSAAHPTSYPMGTRGSFAGVKRPGREADHSPQSIAEVKECVEMYLRSPIRLHGVVLS